MNLKHIPKIIHQSYMHKQPPNFIADNVAHIQKLNPGWEYRLYDSDDMADFIQEHYGSILLNQFLKIDPQYDMARADLFRYLLIYKMGGVWLDIQSSMTQSLESSLQPDDYFLLSQWQNRLGESYAGWGLWENIKHIPGGEFQQWHIISAPKNPLILHVIKKVLYNIRTYSAKNYGIGSFGVINTTGSIAYTLAIAPLLAQFQHRFVDSASDLKLQYSIFEKFYVGLNVPALDGDLVLNVGSFFDGSAQEDDLIAPISGTVTIKAGEPSGTMRIYTNDDDIVEDIETLTFAVTGIESYNGNDLGNYLIMNAGTGTIIDNDEPEVPDTITIQVSDASLNEADGQMVFTVSHIGQLNTDETLTVSLTTMDISATGGSDYVGFSGEVTFDGSSNTQTFSVPIMDDQIEEPDETFYLAPTSFQYNGTKEVVLDNAGIGTIIDNDGGHPTEYDPYTEKMQDPLALDTDKDGFISTVSLADSNVYFDLTGDGVVEKTGWVAGNDGILVYDKKENGQIDGIDEVFSGFTELKELADSNHDGKIDRQDELYSRLQIWHDNNGDGKVEDGELVSLKDAGVKSIKLDYVSTNIELNQSNISEASKYTTTDGTQELTADVKFEYNPILTTVDISTIPDFTVDLQTLALPNLRGFGTIVDSFISLHVEPINQLIKGVA